MTFEIKNTDQIITEMKISLIENVDEINDANIGSVMDTIITVLSQQMAEQYDTLDLIYKSTRVDTAEGLDLEQIGSLVGVLRNEGSKSTGVVTFIRNSESANNFVIPLGTEVSTQPNTDEPQLFFRTINDVTFQATINDEEKLYIEGIRTYRFNQRFVNSITNVVQNSSSVNTSLYNLESFDNQTLIDSGSYTLIDDLDSTSNWSSSGAGSVSLNTSLSYLNNNSMNLLKDTSNATAVYESSITPVDISNKSLGIYFRLESQILIDTIKNIKIRFGNSGPEDNYYETEFTEFAEGWQLLVVKQNTENMTGFVNTNAINMIEIEVTMNSASNTLVADNLLVDNVHFSNHFEYSGEVISFSKDAITSNENFFVSYNPLSVDIECEAEEVGTQYNVQSRKIVFRPAPSANINRILNYSSFTGGLNTETDEEYRERIKTAEDFQNVATVNAIQTNLLALPFIADVSVVDLPERVASEEVITFDENISKYKLLNQIPIGSSITIGNSSSGDDYLFGVDFTLTINGEIEWINVANSPSNGNDFYVNYNYNKLGHAEVTIVGVAGELTTEQSEEVQEVINSVKAAGVKIDIIEPTFVEVNIEITVLYEDGSNITSVNSDIENALNSYIQSRGVGKTIYISGIIKSVMLVDNVKNVVVNDLNGSTNDLSVAVNESTILGEVTINEE